MWVGGREASRRQARSRALLRAMLPPMRILVIEDDPKIASFIVNGLKQSGFPAYRLADPAAHRDLIAVAADDARLILGRDPGLTSERGRAVQPLRTVMRSIRSG